MDVPQNEKHNSFKKVSALKVIETNSETIPFAPHIVTWKMVWFAGSHD